ncbi:MAG TPA: hypothetical protein VJX23_10995 [Candidatus Binataceae bacterium]|nr:hypothetical protein [Candidatus Binataceae bacterium]
MTDRHLRAILLASPEPLKYSTAAGSDNRLILIFYAFAREIGPFKRRLKNRRPLEHRDLRGFRAEVAGTEIAAIATGIGIRRARDAARRAFEVYPDIELAIGAGIAGALTSGLGPGDLVLADRVIVHHAADDEAEHVTAIDAEHLSQLGRMLHGAGLRYSSGAILTSHRVLPGSVEKRRAKERTGAIAVDMETASIASEAGARGIPFASVRTIIDAADDEVVGAGLADEDGRVSPLAATGHLIRNPGEIFKLPRMMLNLNRATRSLADALEVIAWRGEMPPNARGRAAGKNRR